MLADMTGESGYVDKMLRYRQPLYRTAIEGVNNNGVISAQVMLL